MSDQELLEGKNQLIKLLEDAREIDKQIIASKDRQIALQAQIIAMQKQELEERK